MRFRLDLTLELKLFAKHYVIILVLLCIVALLMGSAASPSDIYVNILWARLLFCFGVKLSRCGRPKLRTDPTST